MRLYMAPMEGLTTYAYRNAFAKYYGGIDRYFTPFLSNRNFNHKEREDVSPENNRVSEAPGSPDLIPQILTNRSDEFLEMAGRLAGLGYKTVNLNVGCPSGTVTARHRGAGFLAVPEELDVFLGEIFEKCPIGISIKTRLGVSSPGEWEHLLDIFGKYPFEEVIVHTRVLEDFYKRPTRPECFLAAEQKLHVPVVYNGDIFRVEDLDKLADKGVCPDTLMLGRGLLRRPWLASEIRKTAGQDEPGTIVPDEKKRLRAFHDDIYHTYCERVTGGDRNILFKMKELWVQMGEGMTGVDKLLKQIRKAETCRAYESAVNALFRDL